MTVWRWQMSDSLRLQTLALLGQEFLTQALSNGGSLNSAMADMLLQSKTSQRTGKDISASALTGRIRSDAGMLRQSAKNASEGAAMADLIKEGTLSIAETLNKMQTVMQEASSAYTPALQTEYDNLVSSLKATISNTQYNGISLLDGGKWDSDERLTKNGNTASLDIQMGGGTATFSLRDLSSLGAYEGLNLQDSGALSGKLTQISEDIGTVTTMSTGYEAIAGSYLSDAKHLENQSVILTKAALRTQYGTPADGDAEGSVKSILLDFILREQGKLVDTSS